MTAAGTFAYPRGHEKNGVNDDMPMEKRGNWWLITVAAAGISTPPSATH
jgi:hypothetical protein